MKFNLELESCQVTVVRVFRNTQALMRLCHIDAINSNYDLPTPLSADLPWRLNSSSPSSAASSESNISASAGPFLLKSHMQIHIIDRPLYSSHEQGGEMVETSVEGLD